MLTIKPWRLVTGQHLFQIHGYLYKYMFEKSLYKYDSIIQRIKGIYVYIVILVMRNQSVRKT